MNARTDEDSSFDDWWQATHSDASTVRPHDPRTSVRIKARIDVQVKAAKKRRQWNQPLIGELLVPFDLSKSTFLLPAVGERIKEFLPLAESVSKGLAPLLNWAPPTCKSTDRSVQKWRRARLSAVETPADGNCLLHAVSLCLWGQHDPGSVLRSLMRSIFEDKQSEKRMFDIWKEGEERADAAALGMASFKMEQSQVVAEWAKLAEAAKGLSTYLSSFHAFVLANVLGRPIVILADEFIRGWDGEAYAPSDMRGIYLPTLKSANACYPTPIVIGYTCEAVGKVGHFTALVGVCGELGYIPLVDECGVGLPVRYGVPPNTRPAPRPEEAMLQTYVEPAAFRTAEGAKYLMALVHEVSMAPEAEETSRTLARKTTDKFDWLRREQVSSD
ncbi:unnamed protein product [Ascophyllum nodosum]